MDLGSLNSLRLSKWAYAQTAALEGCFTLARGSEWGVAERGRGEVNVPLTRGNAGRESIKNGGILEPGGYPRQPGSTLGGSPGEGADFWTIFGSILGGIGSPFGSLGDPGGPQFRHFSAPGAPFCSPGAASEAPRGKDLHFSCFEVSKSKVVEGAGSENI